jgi:hypothetical protein
MNYKLLNKRQRKPKEQSRMDNPETLAKLDTRQGTKFECYLIPTQIKGFHRSFRYIYTCIPPHPLSPVLMI